MNWQKNNYHITDDISNIDLDFITETLNSTYWAKDRPRDVIEKSIKNSVFLSLFKEEKKRHRDL